MLFNPTCSRKGVRIIDIDDPRAPWLTNPKFMLNYLKSTFLAIDPGSSSETLLKAE